MAKKEETKCSHINTHAKLDMLPRDLNTFFFTNFDTDVAASKLSGHDRMNSKDLNKGLVYNYKERQLMNLQGILPIGVDSENIQIQRVLTLIGSMATPIQQLEYLWYLEDINRRLFYKVMSTDVDRFLDILSQATFCSVHCTNLFITKPKGLFITIKDKGHVYDVLKNWPEPIVRDIFVTDGESVLGTTDMGVDSMSRAIQKLQIQTLLGGIKPHFCLPIVLDVGCDNSALLKSKYYMGIREPRVKGKAYYDFIDEFLIACTRRWGSHVLIQFEDMGITSTISILKMYRNKYCLLNCSVQYNGCAVMGGIFAALKIAKKSFRNVVILFYGNRATLLGTLELCKTAYIRQGLSEADARKHIWICDLFGVVVKNRANGDIDEIMMGYAQEHDQIDTLEEAVRIIKPDILVGCSGHKGAFSKEVLYAMNDINDAPIIFALNLPSSMVECTPEEAFLYTRGKCIYSCAFMAKPIKYANKVYNIGQANSLYVSAGIALGILCSGMVSVPDEAIVAAAERLADLVPPSLLEEKCIYPPLKTLKCCTLQIAEAILAYAYRKKLATLWPEPKNRMDYIKSQLYDLNYSRGLPELFCTQFQHIGTLEASAKEEQQKK